MAYFFLFNPFVSLFVKDLLYLTRTWLRVEETTSKNSVLQNCGNKTQNKYNNKNSIGNYLEKLLTFNNLTFSFNSTRFAFQFAKLFANFYLTYQFLCTYKLL